MSSAIAAIWSATRPRPWRRFLEGAFAGLAKTRRDSPLERPPEGEGPLAAPEHVAVELAFWRSVTESDAPAMYEAYLEKYPGGEFASLARVRLDELGIHPSSEGGGH